LIKRIGIQNEVEASADVLKCMKKERKKPKEFLLYYKVYRNPLRCSFYKNMFSLPGDAWPARNSAHRRGHWRCTQGPTPPSNPRSSRPRTAAAGRALGALLGRAAPRRPPVPAENSFQRRDEKLQRSVTKGSAHMHNTRARME